MTPDEIKRDVEKFLAIAEDLPDEDIAKLATEANGQAAYFRALANAYNGEAIRRVNLRGATMLVTPGWIGEKTVEKTYVWDKELLQDNVMPMVPPEMWDGAFGFPPPPPPPPPPEPKVNTVKMLALGKKLGLDLSPFYRVDESNPKIAWKERLEDKPL